MNKSKIVVRFARVDNAIIAKFNSQRGESAVVDLKWERAE